MRIEVVRGDDSDFQLTFKDYEGTAINLTDGTVFFTVKANKTDADKDALIKKTISTFETPMTGIMVLSLSHAETSIDVKDYYFDIQLRDSLGRISSTYAGKFIVKQDITQDIS